MPYGVPTYLYGLILARNAAAAASAMRGSGIGGSVVRVIPCGALGALVSSVDAPPSRTSLADVRAHDGVARQVVDAGVTAAACRFGQTFADDAEACRSLAEQGGGERLTRLLQQLDGCVEMRVLVPTTSAPREQPLTTSPAGGPGRAYLERLRSSSRHRVRGASMRGALGDLVSDERAEALPGARGIAYSHLVRRDDVQAYLSAVGGIPGLEAAQVIGPLPLYSFAAPDPNE